jgi:phosphatidylserine decarboxylase
MTVVLVGALNVSSISTFTRGEVASGSPRLWDETGRALQGAEIGRFNMGSTVIVLLGPRRLTWNAGTTSGTTVRMGQALASLAGS